MTRLFTALWLPDGPVAALRAVAGREPPGWRAVDPASWHVTLAFHGDADPGVHARALDAAARGAEAPALRLAGAGAFDGVRWAGVVSCGPIAELVRLAGGAPETFVPHVTVWRRRRRPGPAADPDPVPSWAAHEGPWWHPGDVLLVASEPARGGARYRPVHRVPLG